MIFLTEMERFLKQTKFFFSEIQSAASDKSNAST